MYLILLIIKSLNQGKWPWQSWHLKWTLSNSEPQESWKSRREIRRTKVEWGLLHLKVKANRHSRNKPIKATKMPHKTKAIRRDKTTMECRFHLHPRYLWQIQRLMRSKTKFYPKCQIYHRYTWINSTICNMKHSKRPIYATSGSTILNLNSPKFLSCLSSIPSLQW